MRIAAIHSFQPHSPGSPADWRTSLGQIAVEVTTDTGLTGCGVGGGGAASIHLISAVLAPLLTGRDAEPVEEHWQAMYDATLPFGRKGIAIMAISGVDLALWDLRAKAAGIPVAVLLGGQVGQPVPTYTTVWDVVDQQTAAGSQAVKLHVHPHVDDARQLVERVAGQVELARQALGAGRPLMVDAWMQWDLPTTLAIARRIAPLDIQWLEEPLPVDDLDGYAALRDQCPIPIAGGEHEFTALGFQPLIEQRLHQVLQPDACWVGGLTQLVRIYEMAAAAGLRVVPHRGAEVWGLHALAALDPNPLAESGRPWIDWVTGQPSIQDGVIRPGDAPGFGVAFRA